MVADLHNENYEATLRDSALVFQLNLKETLKVIQYNALIFHLRKLMPRMVK